MEPDPHRRADPSQQDLDVSRASSLTTQDFNLQCLRIVRCTAQVMANSPASGAFLHPKLASR